MIGRAVFSDPFAFARSEGRGKKDEERGELQNTIRKSEPTDFAEISPGVVLPLCYRPGWPMDTLKRFFKIYIRDFDGVSDSARNWLMHTTSLTNERRHSFCMEIPTMGVNKKGTTRLGRSQDVPARDVAVRQGARERYYTGARRFALWHQ